MASVPELQMNALSSPVASANRSASCSCQGIRTRFPLCSSKAAWSAMTCANRGWAWPREQTPRPLIASRYRLPLSSHNQAPSPRAKATGSGA